VQRFLKSKAFQTGDGYVFKNGCRAPPQRQLHGDIAYIEVRPFDGNLLYITANTSGYYVNKVKAFFYSKSYNSSSVFVKN
jgi:hypothetical protein